MFKYNLSESVYDRSISDNINNISLGSSFNGCNCNLKSDILK